MYPKHYGNSKLDFDPSCWICSEPQRTSYKTGPTLHHKLNKIGTKSPYQGQVWLTRVPGSIPLIHVWTTSPYHWSLCFDSDFCALSIITHLQAYSTHFPLQPIRIHELTSTHSYVLWNIIQDPNPSWLFYCKLSEFFHLRAFIICSLPQINPD